MLDNEETHSDGFSLHGNMIDLQGYNVVPIRQLIPFSRRLDWGGLVSLWTVLDSSLIVPKLSYFILSSVTSFLGTVMTFKCASQMIEFV